jgi:hypothetical protein
MSTIRKYELEITDPDMPCMLRFNVDVADNVTDFIIEVPFGKHIEDVTAITKRETPWTYNRLLRLANEEYARIESVKHFEGRQYNNNDDDPEAA